MRLTVIISAACFFCLTFPALAQVNENPSRTIEPTRPSNPLPQTLPSPIPPPSLELEPSLPLPIEPFEIEDRVTVRTIEVLGSTVFSRKELEEITAPFINKILTFEQLLAIRSAVTNLYITRGYNTSRAFLPFQDFTSGKLQVQVVEREIESIEVEGLKRLNDSYVRSRLVVATKAPVNIPKLEQALQLLQLNPLFDKVNVEFTTGSSPGRNVLLVKLQEANPLDGAIFVDNKEPPSVGSFGGTVVLTHNNLLGVGDRLSTAVGITEGVNSYQLNYTVPINSRDGTLSFNYDNGRNRVVEQPFAPIGIRGKSQSYSVSLRQPLVRTPTEEFAFSLSADLRQSRTFLLDDEPFSFTEGPENGESKVSVLRFGTDWIQRRSTSVLAARSQFSVGLGILGATVNDTVTDGRFFSWLGQVQWVQALNSKRDAVIISNVAAQLTPDSLLPLEQFAIGGSDSVRGYRTNQSVASNGIFSSVEVRLPIIREESGFGLIQLTPFVEAGTVWGNNLSTDTLLSTGLGLRYQLGNSLSARIDWGIPLISIDRQGDSLQDNGISFSLQFNPF